MAKAKKLDVVEEVVQEEVVSVADKVDATGRFAVSYTGGKFYVYNPDGVRISSAMEEVEANDLARRMQKFKR